LAALDSAVLVCSCHNLDSCRWFFENAIHEEDTHDNPDSESAESGSNR
jgi:hypothetical protein